eukprot:6193423-Pleurochrysis_carterae.AAC.2
MQKSLPRPFSTKCTGHAASLPKNATASLRSSLSIRMQAADPSNSDACAMQLPAAYLANAIPPAPPWSAAAEAAAATAALAGAGANGGGGSGGGDAQPSDDEALALRLSYNCDLMAAAAEHEYTHDHFRRRAELRWPRGAQGRVWAENRGFSWTPSFAHLARSRDRMYPVFVAAGPCCHAALEFSVQRLFICTRTGCAALRLVLMHVSRFLVDWDARAVPAL